MLTTSCAPRSECGRVRLGIFALTALAAAASAFAQAPAPAAPPPPMATSVPPPSFAIKGFTVTGDNPLGDAETQRVLAPYVRNDASIDTLQQAAAALEKSLRDRGFGLHRVSLPPQEVGASVRLTIVQFTIAKVDTVGRSIYSEGNIRRTLPELKEGGTPNFSKLAIQTAIANENPNKQIQVSLKESDEIDKIDATIAVKELKPWNIGVGISNAGTKNSGRDRFTVTASHSNLFDLDHQFVGAYTTSLQRPGDVKQIGLTYKVPLYALGGVIGLTATKSDVVGNFGAFSSTGAGHTLGATYTHYLPPEGGRRSYLSLSIDDKVFNATEIDGVVAGVDRRSRPITVGYAARVESDAAAYGYDVALAVNTGTGSHNDEASYAGEAVDTVHWKALRGSANYTAPFAGTWLWALRGSWQYSPDPLISGESFGLGGLGSIRGTSIDRPITGDSGLAGTLEVSTPEWFPGLRFLGFVDAGWLSSNDAAVRGKPSSDRLASAGLGLRYVREPFAVSMDYGRIFLGSKVPLSTNSAAPKSGDDRFYVTLQVRF
jgi:hemolysin activation/secretion protein